MHWHWHMGRFDLLACAIPKIPSRLTATQYLDALSAGGFVEKRKVGRTSYYINLALTLILTGPAMGGGAVWVGLAQRNPTHQRYEPPTPFNFPRLLLFHQRSA
jgi:hypothetical protein